MQHFTRKVGESLLIGENIRITVLDIDGSQARIGIQDPEGRMGIGNREPGPDLELDKRPVRNLLISGDILKEEIGDQLE